MDKKKIIIIVSMIVIVLGIALFIFKDSLKLLFVESISDIKDKNYSAINLTVPIEKQRTSKLPNIKEYIKKNAEEIVTEKIERKETDIEFTTQYRNNNSLAKGKIQVVQEGQDGKQNAIIKSTYVNGVLTSEKQISSEITKVAVDKIVEVGTAAYSNNYVPIVGDTLEVTSRTLAIKLTNNEASETIITINKGDKVTLKERQDEWYYISLGNGMNGFAPANCLTYFDPYAGTDGDENNPQYSKEQLTQDLGFSMLLNKRSGLSLEQFKKVLSGNEDDEYKLFEENAEYFYYVEQQYNINGLFVAAVGIHESAWGTSEIARDKRNIFGYMAYDSDPYNSASNFSSCAEGIDLVARVFVKYYLNPEGTPIYNGETAVASYYNGATLTGVNQRYATDKNWANAVYKWMVYLYNRL